MKWTWDRGDWIANYRDASPDGSDRKVYFLVTPVDGLKELYEYPSGGGAGSEVYPDRPFEFVVSQNGNPLYAGEARNAEETMKLAEKVFFQ